MSEPIQSHGRGVRWRDVAISALTVLYFVFALFPVVWMIILSLKPQDKLFTTYFQFEPTLAAYREILRGPAVKEERPFSASSSIAWSCRSGQCWFRW